MARVGDLSELSKTERLGDELRAVSVAPSARFYWIQPVAQLPRVDLSVTLVSRLFCHDRPRSDRLAFNARVLAFVDRWLGTLQWLMLVAIPCTIAVFFLRDPVAQAVCSLLSLCASTPLLLIAFATMSFDMTKLVLATFEFWFLTAANVVNTAIFFSMFRDVRAAGIIGSSLFLQFTLFTDANLRTRLVELRFLVFGPPGMLVAIAACVFRFTPGLHHSSLNIFGTSVADVDLFINCNFIIAFFTARKTHRNRHLLSAKHAAERHIVQCQMYFPTCRLVASDATTVNRLRVKSAMENDAFARRKSRATGTTIEYEQTLHMVSSASTNGINVDRLVLPRASHCRLRASSRLGRFALNTVAFVGIVSATVTHAVSILRLELPSVFSHTSHQIAVEILGLIATLTTTLLYALNCQRDLLRMLISEVDAWFAAVHFTMVMVCVADIVRWRHDAISVLSAWIWSVWVLLLDAVPPAARRRLGFQRWLLLLINILLMLFHVSLLYALFFASSSQSLDHAESPPTLQNRVLFDLNFEGFHLRLEMFSFVTSKIFTSFVWMGRFLWREILRPRDAFKLIKHRVQFLIPFL